MTFLPWWIYTPDLVGLRPILNPCIDHQFLEAEKYDSKRTYKGFDGYSPGVFTIGGLIAYLVKP